MTPSRSAIHEAAHAFVAHHFGAVIERCEVFSGGGGTCNSLGLSCRRSLRVVLAGHIGATLMLGAENVDPDISGKDVEKAVSTALKIACAGEARRLAARGLAEPDDAMLARYQTRAEKLIAFAEDDVRELLDANRPALQLLAERLEECGTLDHATISSIIASATAGPG